MKSITILESLSNLSLIILFNYVFLTQVEVPKLTFHFKGADLELPGENYMIGDSRAGLICLAIGSSRGMSIFGNLQQQNFMVVHDLQEETLSFLPTQCDSI